MTQHRFRPIKSLFGILAVPLMVISLSICVLGCSSDDDNGFSSEPTADASNEAKVFLWEVETGTNSIYLLGSVHVLSEDDHPLPQSMEAAFDDAEQLVFELDLDSAETVAVTQFQRKGMTWQGESLKSTLTESEYERVKQIITKEGIPARVIDLMDPWFVEQAVTQAKLMELGFDSEYGVDQYFYDKAKAAQKPVHAFETVAFQIDLFDLLPADQQIQMLKDTLAQLDTAEDELDSMLDAWKSGDAGALEDLVDSYDEYPELAQALIDDRNDDWMVQMAPFLESEDDYLIVVGAGHLIGDRGLVSQLEDEGYAVEQLGPTIE